MGLSVCQCVFQLAVFVPSWLISDNFLIGFECMHAINNNQRGNVALNLDMRMLSSYQMAFS